LAIYHFHAKMVHRAKGQSTVAAAAYRSGSRLLEESTGITHDYTHKRGVDHTEILAPEDAPAWVFDRHTLWNTVEASEKRKDAQVAREVEVGLPIELKDKEQIALLRDFVQREFVAKGMVADIGIHRDNPQNPHSHILLTTRDLTPEGFGPENRSWNATQQLLNWRLGWAEVTNEHLIEAGLGVRIDHRSYHEQNLGLIPGVKIGVGKERQHIPDLPGFLADRVAEQQRIMAANGKEIIADPTIALKALSHSNATFSH
jgi:ATP-dependent exoDNAse (exonuclease V) alpha subunit